MCFVILIIILSFKVAIIVFETLSLICNLMHLSIDDCFKFNKLRCFKTLKVQFKNTNEINSLMLILQKVDMYRGAIIYSTKVIIIIKCVRLRAQWSYITWFQVVQRPMLTLSW